MRAGSQVLSAGRRRRRLRCRPPGFSRSKSPAAAVEDAQVPVLLLQDMNLCYRLLRQLVPGRAASRVEILQHVIDYILDLQTELDSPCPARDPGELQRGDPQRCDRQQQRQQRPHSDQTSGLNIHSCRSSDVPRKDFEDEESWTLLR